MFLELQNVGFSISCFAVEIFSSKTQNLTIDETISGSDLPTKLKSDVV